MTLINKIYGKQIKIFDCDLIDALVVELVLLALVSAVFLACYLGILHEHETQDFL